MEGFGICLWWTISKAHPLAKVQRQVTRTFGTPAFDAHISVRTRLPVVPQEYPFPKSPISVERRVYRTQERILSWDADFYALEVPVTPVWPLPRSAHVSLAYRFDRPFTDKEVALAEGMLRGWVGPHTLFPKDLEPEVRDARSKSIEAWAQPRR